MQRWTFDGDLWAVAFAEIRFAAWWARVCLTRGWPSQWGTDSTLADLRRGVEALDLAIRDLIAANPWLVGED